jgi:outer membrane lipoprotein
MPAMLPTALIAAIVLGLSACAGNPRFDRAQYEEEITPAQAARAADSLQGKGLLWGGLVIATSNLEDRSEIEVLAYPLDRGQQPDTSRTPLGRFIATTGDYLETVDYAEGRLVTVAGRLSGTREGRIGDTRYLYPVLETAPEHIERWPTDGRIRSEPRFSFGLGVLLGN